MPLPYLEIVVGLAVAVHLLHSWLDLRQLRQLQARAPPPALAGEFGGEKYLKVRALCALMLCSYMFKIYILKATHACRRRAAKACGVDR